MTFVMLAVTPVLAGMGEVQLCCNAGSALHCAAGWVAMQLALHARLLHITAMLPLRLPALNHTSTLACCNRGALCCNCPAGFAIATFISKNTTYMNKAYGGVPCCLQVSAATPGTQDMSGSQACHRVQPMPDCSVMLSCTACSCQTLTQNSAACTRLRLHRGQLDRAAGAGQRAHCVRLQRCGPHS